MTLYEIDSGILELCALLDAAPDTGEVGAGCEDILARLDILHFRRVAVFFALTVVRSLLPYRDSAGREVSVERHVARSRAKFGKVCCLDCINAARAGDAESETEDSGGQ